MAKPGKTDAELKEEEELQLVLALSKEKHPAASKINCFLLFITQIIREIIFERPA